ncbi:MAG TPA: amidohydrolase [Spirochaetota bacterium]|nr:amidohydrolase [Spirochaetota bacterium]
MDKDEILFHNCTVRTMDPANPVTEAVAIRDGRIVFTGGKKRCTDALGRRYRRVDLKGATLVPGFCDSHIHPLSTIYYDMNVNLHGVRNMDEMRARLLERTGTYLEGKLIIGVNFDEQGMDRPTLPSRTDLDAVSDEIPVAIIKHDGHTVYLNTRALEAAGITASTPDPTGGLIARDSSGVPTGALHETAVKLAINHFPAPKMDDFYNGARRSFGRMLRHGITSLGLIIQTGIDGPEGILGALDIPVLEAMTGEIPQSLSAYVMTESIASLDELKARPVCSRTDGKRLRVLGLKIISDGTFGSCTAAMREPFCDFPDRRGFMLNDVERMYALMKEAHLTGYQIAVHAIGDLANRTCIDLYGRLMAEHPLHDRRHRIEHASMLDRDMIADASKLGLVLCVQPMFIDSEHHWLGKRFGPGRLPIIYPFRSALDAGMVLAGASDSPVESQNVMAAIEACVTRCGMVPEESITVEQALAMYTSGAAYALFDEKNRGSITPGKAADFVALGADPLKVPAHELHSVPVLMTVVGGTDYRHNQAV